MVTPAHVLCSPLSLLGPPTGTPQSEGQGAPLPGLPLPPALHPLQEHEQAGPLMGAAAGAEGAEPAARGRGGYGAAGVGEGVFDPAMVTRFAQEVLPHFRVSAGGEGRGGCVCSTQNLQTTAVACGHCNVFIPDWQCAA